MEASDGFPAVARADACVLVLGSLPGQRSIAAQQYYAHPQNAFWPIMRELFGIEGDYDSRCTQLLKQQVALWDVLASSIRPGSMDSDIRMDSARPNDFATFFDAHAKLEIIAFNGKKAEQIFGRFVGTEVVPPTIRCVGLPSTSPAYAAMPFSGKLLAWREALLASAAN